MGSLYTQSLCRRSLDLGLGVLGACLRLLGASLPNRCLVCHQAMPSSATGICPVCLAAGLYSGAVCLGCGKSMVLHARYCGQCQKSEPLPVLAPCSYHQGLGPWVAAIKYQRQFAALPVLSLALAERVKMLEGLGLVRLPQALVPVPLHPQRLKQRGFNQAWLIAAELGKLLQLPVAELGLSRRTHTRPQAGLTGLQRRRNLRDAFRLDGGQVYQRIALVDDVLTTGTTAREIARLFGARNIHVQVWCLARAEAPGLLDEVTATDHA
ncbi:ComF family protein [Shewanella sp. AS16]|uniref:ComF family protein n=1 Tax=Shewanella sp. AS16 TaxID=2907625 RepID=UPI0022797E0F|nr:ComF family protein [Shewanella sp. AS16]